MLEYTNLATISDKDFVDNLWENEECPYFNLIMFGTGLICELEDKRNDNGGGLLKPKAWMAATSAFAASHSEGRNEGFAILCTNNYPDLNLMLLGGECCASGENGFIAATELSSGKLLWLVFLMDSNPFDAVELQGAFVVAKSTLGHSYRLSLLEPQDISWV